MAKKREFITNAIVETDKTSGFTHDASSNSTSSQREDYGEVPLVRAADGGSTLNAASKAFVAAK